MLKKPTGRITLAVLVAVVAVGVLLLRGMPQVSADTDPTYQKLKLLAEVLETVQSKYVDEPDPEKLIYGAIKGMVASLDPHSSFLTPSEFQELQIETSGKFSGIGIEITVQEGILTVVSPIEDTPAFKVGLQAGDKIIKVDGKLTKQMSLMEAVKSIRGPKGTKVVLTILRSGQKELMEFVIVRDVIPIVSVKTKNLSPGYGYIRVTTFQARTSADVRDALAEMTNREDPLKGLVMDLRNNPGGLLNEAVDLADLFLDEGLIVYTEGRVANQNMKFYARSLKTPSTYPMVILVNQGSASASEIVAGALKDHGRAVILGTRTFGKGSVQTIIPFGDNSGMRLTTARYFTPSGVSIQAKGIEPDVLVEAIPPTEDKTEPSGMREADIIGHMENDAEPDAQEAKDQEAAEMLRRDNQLREALGLLKGWEIFSRTRIQAKNG